MGYKEAFGLKDNPFGPMQAVPGLPPRLTADLQTRPLLLHKNDKLEQFYCESLSSFYQAYNDLDVALEVAGYTANPPGRGVSSYLVSIGGDRGAGKTTLACRMLQMMRQRSPKDEPAWHLEEALLNSTQQTLTEQLAELTALETRVIASQQDYVCILIDDLRADAYAGVTTLYDKLRNHAVVFMVFTSWDAGMQEQLDKTLHAVHRFSIAPLSPDDAVAFVHSRYEVFRVQPGNSVAIDPLFPFDEDDIRTAVAVRVISGASSTGPVSLRMFATILQAALLKRLQEIAVGNDPAFDVHAAPADKLHAMRIRVAQAYEIVVRP
jgi:hypothetical protein